MTPTVAWPSGLPAPQLAGKSGQAVDPQVRTPLASGRTRVRLAFDAVPVNRQMNFIMTSEQAVRFEQFYRSDTKNGTLWFAMELNLPQGRGPWAFQFQGPLPEPSEVGPPSQRRWMYTGVQMQQWLRATDNGGNP